MTRETETSPPLVQATAITTVPSTILTHTNAHHNRIDSTDATVLHRHTKETYTYCYETDEDLATLQSHSKANTHTNTHTMTTNTPPEEGEQVPSQSSTASSVTTESESSSEPEPYKELKWTAAPLFLNDGFDTHELSLKDKQTLPLHAGRTALLVVDVQPEYWSQCPAVRKDFPDFPQHLQSLVAQCRAQKAKIIWVRADYRYAHSPWLVQFARLHKGQIPAEVHSDPSQQDEIEWEDFATPLGGEYVIPKTSWSSTRHTALMDLLKQSGIDTVLVAGLITSVCVQHSAFGIFEAGYRTLLVTDACADRGKARHDAALALYGDYMYELLTVADLCEPSNPYYLRPAKPVWLTPDSVNNLVQPQFFNSLQDSIVMHTRKSGDFDTRTMTTSNKHGHPTFYTMDDQKEVMVPLKTEDDDDTKEEEKDHGTNDPHGINIHKQTMMNSTATARTSTSSLSTLTNPSPLLEATVMPAEEAPPTAIHV